MFPSSCCSSSSLTLDSPSGVGISDPTWVAPGDFICARLIGFSCIILHSPVIEDFAPYSLVLQNRVYRDLFYLSVRLYPKFLVGTLMSEGFVNFSSILQAKESMAEEKGSLRRGSIIRASAGEGKSSSVKPSSPSAPSSRGPHRIPAFSASAIPSTITNEELAILRVRYSIPSSVSLQKPSGTEWACSFSENETCLYVGALEGGLRLPFPTVVRDVLSFLGLAPGQIVPNSWRLLIGCAALWGAMSDGQISLTNGPFLNQFSVKEAPGGFGWYYFAKRAGEGELVTELPSATRGSFPLSPALEAELQQARSYSVHTWDLLVTPESLAAFLLGSETTREALALLREEEGEDKAMAPKMDKALLAQLKAERAKQTPEVAATKRKSSRLQTELGVDSFLEADLSIIPSIDLVVEPHAEGEMERSKRKAKSATVGGTLPAKKAKVPVGPSTLGNFQEALERALLCAADEDSMAERSLQSVGEHMLVEQAMATARGRYLASQSHSLGNLVVTLTEANLNLTKQGASMSAELQKAISERDAILKSKRGLEEERDVAVATARSLEQKISEWSKEREEYRTMNMGMLEKVKNAHREAIQLFLKSPEYRRDITQQYFNGFEAMRSQAALAFPDLDFSKFEVDDEKGPSCFDGGQKAEDEADDAVSKDTSVPSSSLASLLQTPEKVSLDTPILAATPLGPSSGDGQALDNPLMGL
ncbi:hypothetical protein RHMOL_Rhmol07G0175900 [Rhododendron molle]|uniref:Uncharacterized protein n=1 Tax=Rhododendron molle TaxID=49168 RepID=A0ACC0N1R6_RHOML|nr:hypothetical protein RHMOL_Rhmol07G0175900 [Rhododendron molle]